MRVIILANVGCVDCEELAEALFELGLDVWTCDDDTYTCKDGEHRCLDCALRNAWPADVDRCAHNVCTWAGVSHTLSDAEEVEWITG